MQKSSNTEFLYGLNPAFECLKAERRKIFQVHINERSSHMGRIKVLAKRFEEKDVPIDWTDKGRLHQLTGSTEHQNVVIKVSRYPYVDHTSLLDKPRLLLLDNVEDPHNVGAILRSAEVFGFHGIFLPIKGVPEVYPSVSKVSAGAVEFLPIARDCNANTYVQTAIESGYHVASLDAKGKVDLETLSASAPEKLLLVIGGEDKGVGQFIINNSDSVLALPQSGKINSLNASVAAGIAMFELRSR